MDNGPVSLPPPLQEPSDLDFNSNCFLGLNISPLFLYQMINDLFLHFYSIFFGNFSNLCNDDKNCFWDYSGLEGERGDYQSEKG